VNFLDFALRFPFVIAALRTSHEGHELTALDQAGRGARPGRRRRWSSWRRRPWPPWWPRDRRFPPDKDARAGGTFIELRTVPAVWIRQASGPAISSGTPRGIWIRLRSHRSTTAMRGAAHHRAESGRVIRAGAGSTGRPPVLWRHAVIAAPFGASAAKAEAPWPDVIGERSTDQGLGLLGNCCH